MYMLFDVQAMHVVRSHVKYTCFSVRENKNINKIKKIWHEDMCSLLIPGALRERGLSG